MMTMAARRAAVEKDAVRFLKAHRVLGDLRREYMRKNITFQQYSTIRGQALNGDVDGAVKGLARLLARNPG